MLAAPFLRNESNVDRVIRIVLGAVLVGLALAGPQTPWGYLGLVLIITGVVGFCPLYRVLGFSTCAAKPVSPMKKAA